MTGSLPKVLLPIAGKPMAQHVLDTVAGIENSRPIIVIENQKSEVKKFLLTPKNTKWVTQRKQLGTGHAVKTALPELRTGSIAVVLYGDVPLVEVNTLKALIKMARKDSLVILTFNKERSEGYGRIVRGSKNQVEAIVEEKLSLIHI